MNLYSVLSAGVGRPEATSLGARLAEWHDAMVAHERLLGIRDSIDRCDDDCPHADASRLWAEAVDLFGPRAGELTFLRSRATTRSPARARASATAGAGPTRRKEAPTCNA